MLRTLFTSTVQSKSPLHSTCGSALSSKPIDLACIASVNGEARIKCPPVPPLYTPLSFVFLVSHLVSPRARGEGRKPHCKKNGEKLVALPLEHPSPKKSRKLCRRKLSTSAIFLWIQMFLPKIILPEEFRATLNNFAQRSWLVYWTRDQVIWVSVLIP